jgi:hypothetical protein
MPSESDPGSPGTAGIAAAARALGPILLEEIAGISDELADDLATRLGMVAWEREEQIGSAQRRLLELDGFVERELVGASDPCLVRELREQPFEALDLAWRALRQGRRVHVESEAGACPGVFRILRELAERFPERAVSLSPPGVLEHEHSSWRRIGVQPRHGRVALVQADADRELAAYVLARACLRRTGFDPRVVHRVIVVGPSERLERNLRRLWVGARMGPVDDEHAFAGPVDADRAARFHAAEQAWRARESVVTLCPGGRLEHANPASADGDRKQGAFLAPALFRAPPVHGDEPRREGSGSGRGEAKMEFPVDEPSLCGPMLVVYPVLPNTAGEAALAMARGERLLDHFAGHELGHLRFGNKPRELTLRPIDRQLHGALLVERLPPGLPEPRP